MLVPYRRKFVEKYHGWMEDAWIQAQTASESVSLEEEFAAQQAWCDDFLKCTFIILDATHADSAEGGTGAAVGDINLVLGRDDQTEAEVMVMVGEAGSRRKGSSWHDADADRAL